MSWPLARARWSKPHGRTRVITLLAAMLAGLCAHVAAAQATGDTVYRLHGRVVNASTHAGIARALVASGDRRLATMTDSTGAFQLDVTVPAAPAPAPGGFAQNLFINLRATRPGYATGDATLQLTGVGPAELSLQLVPHSTVRGTVQADTLGRVPRVTVLLLRRAVEEGTPAWQQRGSARTDDEGRFRFGELEPGEYTVMTQEWAGDAPAYQRVSQQYPPVYAGDVRSLSAATRLQVRPGADEQLALHLRSAIYYPVSIPVEGSAGVGGVNLRILADGSELGYSLGFDRHTNAVNGSLPSGSYTLLLTTFGSRSLSAQVPFSVADAPVDHAPVMLAEAKPIPVRVRLDFTEQNDGYGQGFGYSGPSAGPSSDYPVTVQLRSVMPGGGGGSSSPKEGEAPVVENLHAGSYIVSAHTIRGYVAAMSSGGVDLLQQPLIVGESGADPIDVVLRNDGGTVTGEVDFPADSPLQFCAVLLVSTDGTHRQVPGFVQRGQALRMLNVPPGSYRAFAIEQREANELPYRSDTAMRALDPLGTPVTVAANGTAQLKLRLVSLAAPEG